MEIDEGQAVARKNKIKESVDRLGSIFMKNLPVVRRWPYNAQGDMAKLSDDIDALYLQAWENSEAQFTVRSMLLEAEIIGLSVGKIYWNALDRTFNTKGAIAIDKCSPYSVIFDPWASNTHRGRDAGYIFHETEEPIGLLLAKYGKEAEIALGERVSTRGRSKDRTGGVTMMLNMAEKLLLNAGVANTEKKYEPRAGYAPVTEIWLFPQEMHESSLSGGDVVKSGEYPHGVVVTVINDRIVHFMKNPFAKRKSRQVIDEWGLPKREMAEIGHKRHPFIPLYWNRCSDREGKGVYGFYDCMGAVEQAIPLQQNLNALRRNIAINARTMANGGVMVHEDALEAPIDTVTFNPSQIYRVKPNFRFEEAIKILEGNQMPQYVYDLALDNETGIDKIMGLEPGVVGLYPQGGGTSHTSGLAFGTLQEAAFGPLWVFVTELGAALLDMSILYDGLIQQYYKAQNYMTISNAGVQRQVEWTDKHITANFKRQVIQGATTPMYDIEKHQLTNEVVTIVNNAIASQNPTIIQVEIAHLEALRYPWANQFQQILEKEYQRTMGVQQGFMRTGAEALTQMQTQQGQMALPEQGATSEMDVIKAMADIEGRDPAEIALALAE